MRYPTVPASSIKPNSQQTIDSKRFGLLLLLHHREVVELLAIAASKKEPLKRLFFHFYDNLMHMVQVSDEEFQELVVAAVNRLPKVHKDNLKNVGFFAKDQPSEKQLHSAGVRQNGLLLGLYEGVPRPLRQGTTGGLPDKITLFKEPLQTVSTDISDLKTNIRQTVWHEVAHYFGLDHDQIHKIEDSWPPLT